MVQLDIRSCFFFYAVPGPVEAASAGDTPVTVAMLPEYLGAGPTPTPRP